jgi:hypothetical protein
MNDLSGAFPLDKLVRETDVAGGFEIGSGFVRMLKGLMEGKDGTMAMAPVLRIKFHMINGEQRKEVCIPLPMILPLIAEFAQFSLAYTGVQASDVMPEDGGH